MSLPLLCVGARSEGCSTSNQCTFHVEELPHLVFCAHAVEGGTVVLQQAPSGLHQLDPAHVPAEQAQPYWLHYLGSGPAAAHKQHQHPHDNSSSSPYTTVLLINDVAAHGEEPIQQLVWGGGPFHLLAAASRRCISFYSLLPFMASLQQAQEAAARQAAAARQQQRQQPLQLHTQPSQQRALQQQQQHPALQPVPELSPHDQQHGDWHHSSSGGGSSSRKRQRLCYHPSIGYEALPAYHLSSQLLDMQWTYDAGGLMLADVLGNVIMLQLSCTQHHQQRQQQGELPADTASAAAAAAAAAAPSEVQQQQWQLQELWRVRADQPQHLIAAGAWSTGPAATVSADSPLRVIIWWPSPDPKTPGAYKVGAEVIRHPVRAVQLQWSPPLPRSGSGGAGRSSSSGGAGAGGAVAAAGRSSGGGAAAAAAGGRGGSAPGSPIASPAAARAAGNFLPPLGGAAAAAAAAGGGGDAAGAAAAAQDGSSSSSPGGQPALMTVGVDGIIRVFVEVVLSDVGPSPPPAPAAAAGAASSKSSSSAAPAAAGSPAAGGAAASAAAAPASKDATAAAATAAASMSQFCLTLVIDPPGLGPQKGLGFKPGLTVTWAKPLANPNPQQPQLLWLVASYVAPQPPAEPLPLAAALSGVSPQAAAAAAAGGLHPGMAVLQPPPTAAGAGRGPAGSAAVHNGNSSSSSSSSMGQAGVVYQDQVHLWAVDGLAGVVLSGIAANAIMSNKICEPRAYLWGKDTNTLTWHHPQLLLQQAAAAHGALAAPQLQQLGSQLRNSSGVPGGLSVGVGQQLGVGFRHSLGAWVVESPAGPLLSVLQQYHAPLASISSSSWAWQGLTQLLQQPHSSNAAAGAAAAADPGLGLGWPLPGVGASAAGSSSGGGVGGGVGAAVSEVRSFQVTPLTGVNEAGQPSSAIAVSATTSRVAAGTCEEWVQVSVHTAADLAAAVSSIGAVAIWSLSPSVQLLPLAPQPHQQHPQQQPQAQLLQQQQAVVLPDSWHSCKTCCWLTFGGATAAAAAAAAGLTGLPLLLAVHGSGGIDICLITLAHPGQQQQQAGFNSSSSGSSSGQQACITGVHVLQTLDTPAGVSGVKQLVELGACQVPLPADISTQAEEQSQQQQEGGPQPLILQATLLGLGGYEPPGSSSPQQQQQQQQQQQDAEPEQQPLEAHHEQQQQQQHPQHVMQRLLSDADRLDAPSQDAWVSWTLQVCLQQQQHPWPQQPQQQHPWPQQPQQQQQQQQQGPFAAVAGVPEPSGQPYPLQLHASRPTLTPIADAASGVGCVDAGDGIDSSGSAEQAGVCGRASPVAAAPTAADVRAAVTCLQCPSPSSPFLVTGNASGMLMLWLAAPQAGPSTATDSNTGPGSTAAQHAAAGAGAAASAVDDSGCGPALQLLQASGCSVGGVNLGGICVAVALCASAGYAAAAITCGQSELEDAVFIWCAEGSTHSNSSSSGSSGHPAGGSSSGVSSPRVLSPRAAAAAAVGTTAGTTAGSSGSGGPFVLDCLLALEDTAASLAWLDTGGLPPLLAVGVASGGVEVYSRDRSGQWNTLAFYDIGLSVNFIAANRLGLPLLVAGSQLLLLSNLAALRPGDCATSSSSRDGVLALPPAATAVAQAPSAAVAAAAGWDDEEDAAAANSQTLAALSTGSMLTAGGASSSQSNWGLVNLCRQLQPLQPLRSPGGPAKGAWLSGAGAVLATHAALAAAAGSSSLPLYHPDVLMLLLGQGRLAAAVRILRCVLEYVIRHKAAAAASSSQEGGAVAAAAAAAGSSSSSGGGGCSAALEALLASGGSQQGALVDAEAVSRCCSFRDAVVAAALGRQPPGGVAAAAAAAEGTAGAAAGSAAAPGAAAAAIAAHGNSSSSQGPAGLSRLGQKPAAAAAAAADWGGPLKPAVAPAPAAAAAVAAGGSSLDTGMLDMSAFGDFGGFGGAAGDDDGWGEEPAAVSAGQQQQDDAQGPVSPPAAAATAAPAAATAAPGSASALETGMLDMSVFGGFGDFGGMQEPEPEPQQQQQEVAPSAASGAQDALATGLLDMSAFGFGADFGGADSTPDEPAAQQKQQQESASSNQAPMQQAAQGGVQPVPPALLAKTLVQFPPAPKKAAGAGSRPGVLLGLSGPAAGTTAAAGAGSAPPAQELLLSRAEVQELHAVLGLPEARKQLAAGHSSSGRAGAGGGSGSSAQAYYSRLLGAAGAADDTGHAGFARSSSGKAQGGEATAKGPQAQRQQQQGNFGVLALLGLNPSQGQQLCNIAAALSTRTFMGEEGAAADDADYSSGVTSSSGPANAAALAASWAAGSSSSTGSYNSVDRRWPGLSRSSSSVGTAGAAPGAGGGGGMSSSSAAALAVIGAPDSGFNAALFQELDAAGRLFAVGVQTAVLQLAVHAAAAPAAAASSGQQEQQRRFSAAVARLFQPVSVSRSHTAQGRKGAALLAHYPAVPLQQSCDTAGSGSSRAAALRPPLSPGRQQQLAGRSAALGSGLRSGGSGLGFGRSGSSRGLAMRSSMSVASMLSFSSLKNESSVDGSSETGAAAAAAVAAAAQAGTRSWSAFMGLLPGLTPLLCLWALSSSSQASVLRVLLPLVPDDIEAQLAAAGVGVATVAAEQAHHHGHGHRQGAGGGGAGGGGSFVATGAGGQEQQVMSWPKLRALGAGLWLTDGGVLRSTAEALAKAQYAVAKDPHEPALMYAALGKKGVLQGLFRSSGNKKVADFLARDFSTPEGRAAASKNAFHLLGQHRHHLAAAFFILSGSHWDAVSVLAHDAADPQLALFVARLLDTAAGDTPAPYPAGPGHSSSSGTTSTSSSSAAVLSLQRRLIDSDLMPLAEADADPAAAALAAWLRGSDGAAAVTVLLSRMLAAQLLDGLDPAQGLLGPAQQHLNPEAASSLGSGSGSGGVGAKVATAEGSSSSAHVGPASPRLRLTNGASSPQPQQQQQQQGSDQGAASGARPHHAQPSSPSPAVLAQLPLLLHWVLSVGLDQLGGRLVSGGLLTALHRLALRVARCAEVSGLPVAAAEALALADAIGDPSAGGSSSTASRSADSSRRGSSSRGGELLGEVLMLMWHARLAAAVLALQLLPDGTGSATASTSSDSGSTDVAHWQAAVARAAPLLQKLGLKVEPEAVAVVLARHALAMQPVLALPAEPAGAGWCWELPQQQLATGDGDKGHAAGTGVHGPFGSSGSQAAAAVAGAGPDAVLAVCLSRTGSLTAASAVASPLLLSRVSSLAAPSAAGAAAAGKGAAGGLAGLAAAAAADGRGLPAGGAVSTGPGWGAQSRQQEEGAQASGEASVPSVLGVSWELARQQGDRLAAVSVCSGAQFSCCLLQQQQQQHTGSPSHAHHADGTAHAARGAAASPPTPRQRMSQPGRGLVRPRPVIYATKGAGMCPAELLAPPNLLSVWTASHAASQHSSGARSSAHKGAATAPGAASSPRHQQQRPGALQEGGPSAGSPRALSPASPYAAASAGSLSGFMSQVLDQLRWPPDPWVVGEYPTRRSGSSLGSAAVGHVQAATVASHPNRPLFVSGSSTGRIYLWQFGEANCKAAYVPLASTAQAALPSKRLSAHEAVSTPHWGNPAAVRFSRSGARFGAVGEGGLVGLWRQDFISAVDGMGHAEWVGHCLSRSGSALAFLGDTGSQVFVSGVGERGGAVVLIDTLAPPNAATAATMLSPRGATPTSLCLVPSSVSSSSSGPGAVLAVGDDAGEVRGYDVRVVDAARPLWSTRQQQQQHHAAAGSSGSDGVTSLTCWDPAWMGGSSVVGVFDGAGSSGSGGSGGWQQCSVGDLLAVGSRDGSISLLHAQTGAVVQRLGSAHYSERKGLLERVGLGGSGRSGAGLEDGSGSSGSSVVLRARPAGAVPAAVSGVQACAEGLVSVGWDGVVRFSPFAQLLNEWSARASGGGA